MVFAVAVALIGILAIWFGEETRAEVSTVPWIAALVVMAPLGPLSLVSDLEEPMQTDPLLVIASGLLALALVRFLLVHVSLMTMRWREGAEKWEHGATGRCGKVCRLGNYIVPFAALALGVLGAFYTFKVWHLLFVDPPGFAMYRFRALRLDGGASPLVPLLLACLATAGGYAWHVSRIALLKKSHPLEKVSLTSGSKGGPAATMAKAVERAGDVRDAFTRIMPSGRVGLSVLIVVPTLFVFLPGLVEFHTIENLIFQGHGASAPSNMILSWTLLAGLMTVAGSTLHLFRSWRAISKHLSALADTPLLLAFARIPDRMRALGRLYLFDPPAPERGEAVFKGLLASVRAQLGRRWGDVEPGQPEVDRLYSSLVDQWEKRPHAIELGQAGAVKPSGDTNLLRAAETAAAVEVVRFIGWALGNLRRLTILLLGSILFTTATLVSFPMPVRGLVTVLFWLLMICSLGIVVMIAGNLSQDEVLSRINGTKPGRITWNRTSMLSVIVIVSLPILGLLAAEVPAVGRALFSWVDPLLRVLINV
jgi:hypothetical protein